MMMIINDKTIIIMKYDKNNDSDNNDYAFIITIKIFVIILIFV